MPRKSLGTRTNERHKSQTLPKVFEPRFIDSLDQRTELAHALRDRFDGIAQDLGGVGELSAIKASLLERFVWLESHLNRMEADLAAGTDPKLNSEIICRWVQATNSLLGIAKVLGLERKLAQAPWLAAAGGAQ